MTGLVADLHAVVHPVRPIDIDQTVARLKTHAFPSPRSQITIRETPLTVYCSATAG